MTERIIEIENTEEFMQSYKSVLNFLHEQSEINSQLVDVCTKLTARVTELERNDIRTVQSKNTKNGAKK